MSWLPTIAARNRLAHMRHLTLSFDDFFGESCVVVSRGLQQMVEAEEINKGNIPSMHYRIVAKQGEPPTRHRFLLFRCICLEYKEFARENPSGSECMLNIFRTVVNMGRDEFHGILRLLLRLGLKPFPNEGPLLKGIINENTI